MIKPDIDKLAKAIFPDVCHWRRDFHRFPEVGWTEFRTTAIVAETLKRLGFQIAMGAEIIRKESRMGVPDSRTLDEAKQLATQAGVDTEWLTPQEDGLTGVLGTWETGRPGPTVAFRFDIDALPIQESDSSTHLPFQEGFHSQIQGKMHACGHDGHTAIGLGLASLIPQLQDHLKGTIKLIFQPAEEGVRGARAMVDAGVLEGVDKFFSGHIGLHANRNGLLACGVTQLLATSKMDVTFRGLSAHAAQSPESGRNALLAAAAATLHLHSISGHSDGLSRINVGVFRAGSGRNIVADKAFLQVETRGETQSVQEYMSKECIRMIQHTAMVYDVKAEIKVVGEAASAECNPELVQEVYKITSSMNGQLEVVPTLPYQASEDAATMMTAVQQQGGKATYLLFGSHLPQGHHHPGFDFDEETLLLALRTYGRLLPATL